MKNETQGKRRDEQSEIREAFWTRAKRAKRDDILETLKGKRLLTMGRYLRDHVPELDFRIDKVEENTDRSIPGTRLRHPGQGREGNEIVIFKKGSPYRPYIKSHNSAETYRTNSEFARWVADEIVGWHEVEKAHPEFFW